MQTPGGTIFNDDYECCFMVALDEMLEENYVAYLTIPEGDLVVPRIVWFRYVVCIWDVRTGKWLYLRPYEPWVPSMTDRKKSLSDTLIAGVLIDADCSMSQNDKGIDWERIQDKDVKHAVLMASCGALPPRMQVQPSAECWTMKIQTFACVYCYVPVKVGMWYCEDCYKPLAYPELFLLRNNETPVVKDRPITNMHLGYERLCKPDWGEYAEGLNGHLNLEHRLDHLRPTASGTQERLDKNKADFRQGVRCLIHAAGKLNGELAERMIHASVYGREDQFKELMIDGQMIDLVINSVRVQVDGFIGGRFSLMVSSKPSDNMVSKRVMDRLQYPIKLGIVQDISDQGLVNKHRDGNSGEITNIFEFIETDKNRFDKQRRNVGAPGSSESFARYQMMAGSIYANMLQHMKNYKGVVITMQELNEYKRQFANEIMPSAPWPRKITDVPLPIANLDSRCYFTVGDDFDSRRRNQGTGGSKRAASRGPESGASASNTLNVPPMAKAKTSNSPFDNSVKKRVWVPKAAETPTGGAMASQEGATQKSVPISPSPFISSNVGTTPVDISPPLTRSGSTDQILQTNEVDLDAYPCFVCGSYDHQGRMHHIVQSGDQQNQAGKGKGSKSSWQACVHCMASGHTNRAYSHTTENCRIGPSQSSQSVPYDKGKGKHHQWDHKGDQQKGHYQKGWSQKGWDQKGPYSKGAYKGYDDRRSGYWGEQYRPRPIRADPHPNLHLRSPPARTEHGWRAKSGHMTPVEAKAPAAAAAEMVIDPVAIAAAAAYARRRDECDEVVERVWERRRISGEAAWNAH